MNDHVPDSVEHVPDEPWARVLTLRAWPWFATLQRCAVASVALGWLAGRATTSAHGAYSPGWVVFGLLIALRWIAGARAAFRTLQRPEYPRHPRLSQLFYVVVPAELVGVMRLLAMTLRREFYGYCAGRCLGGLLACCWKIDARVSTTPSSP